MAERRLFNGYLPCLFKGRHGVWYCRAGDYIAPFGYGPTPAAAFEDFWAQVSIFAKRSAL